MEFEGELHDVTFSEAFMHGTLSEEQIQGLTPEQLQK